jgi:class 3 adenylate cyclase
MPSVLVVDANDINRETLAARLELLGYRVSGGTSGEKALASIEQRPVDAIVLGVETTDLTALEILERRRDNAILNTIPFIILAMPEQMDTVVRCLELGAEDYIPKPFDPLVVRTRMEACLGRKLWQEQERELQAKVKAQAAQLAQLNGQPSSAADDTDEGLRLSRLRQFLSPQLAEAIASWDESVLQSHRREITVAFCDLRGFTAFADTAEPEDIMGVLRDYHAAMGEQVFKHNGTLERFAGDGMMIFFNDLIPLADHAAQAVRMSLSMREESAKLAIDWQKRGYDLGFGMGVAMGYATLGRVGFEGRYDYAAIGSVTNLAARLCGDAEAGQILVNRRVYSTVEDLVEVENVGRLKLKGFSRPMEALNVVSLKAGVQ